VAASGGLEWKFQAVEMAAGRQHQCRRHGRRAAGGLCDRFTDTGHKAAATPGASFALDHPQKLIDFGYRAVHEMTIQSKAMIAAYYGRPPQRSY
jgi:nicotinic acid phosphoribosyltransferase